MPFNGDNGDRKDWLSSRIHDCNLFSLMASWLRAPRKEPERTSESNPANDPKALDDLMGKIGGRGAGRVGAGEGSAISLVNRECPGSELFPEGTSKDCRG